GMMSVRMAEFPVDWFGRCGPHQITVAMPRKDVLELLRYPLTQETFLESVFSFERRSTGIVRDNDFVIWPSKRGRRPQPRLLGKFIEVEEGVRIEFRIEMDSMVSASLTILPLACIGASLIPIFAFIADIDLPFPFAAAPIVFLLMLI